MYQTILTQIGLSDSEARVYQALLKLGPSPVSPIVREAKIKRSNTYAVLDSLINKGLALKKKRAKKIVFEPQAPEKLTALLREKFEAISKTRRDLDELMPALKSQYVLSTRKPIINYFEGIEGLKEVYGLTLSGEGGDIRVFRSFCDEKLVGLRFLKNYMKKRKELGITTKIISDKKITRQLLEDDRRLNKKRVFIKDLSIPAEIDVFDDIVAVFSFGKKIMAFTIKNRAFAESLKKIFDIIYEERKAAS